MPIKDNQSLLSVNERSFVLDAISKGYRVDGRKPLDIRKIRMTFGRGDKNAHAEVQFGHTRVVAVVTAEIVPPFPDRPTEGLLVFNAEFSPMANPKFEAGRPPAEAIELMQAVNRNIRDSRAIDTEALCIVAGEKVWSVRVDMHVLDDGGSLMDVSCFAAIAALRHFRRPEVSVEGGAVVTYSAIEKEPVPLCIHHSPICVTFGFFAPEATGAKSQNSPVFVCDPTDREEAVVAGRLTFALNAHRELCAIHKSGGLAVQPAMLLSCAHTAADKVVELSELLANSLAEADKVAQQQRLDRFRGTTQSDPTLLTPPPPPCPWGGVGRRHRSRRGGSSRGRNRSRNRNRSQCGGD